MQVLQEIALQEGDFQEAQQYFRRSLKTTYDIGTIPHVMNCIVDAAAIFMAFGQKERALELLSLAVAYCQQNGIDIPDRIESKRTALQAELPPDVYAAAWEYGKMLDLKTVVEELLKEES